MLKYILPILLATGGGMQVPPTTTPSRQYSGVGTAGPIGPQGLTGPAGPPGPAGSVDGGVLGSITIDGTLVVDGGFKVNGNGQSTFTGPAEFQQATSFRTLVLADGGLTVGGSNTTTLSGPAVLQGDTQMTSTVTIAGSLLSDGGIILKDGRLLDLSAASPGTVYVTVSGTSLLLVSAGTGLLNGSNWKSQFDFYAGANSQNKAGLRGGAVGVDPKITSDWSSDSNIGLDTAMNGTGTFQVNGVEVPVTPIWLKDSKQAEVQGGTKACASSAWNVTFADAGGVAFSATPKWCTVTDEQGSIFTITLKSSTQLGGVCVGTDTLNWECWGDK